MEEVLTDEGAVVDAKEFVRPEEEGTEADEEADVVAEV